MLDAPYVLASLLLVSMIAPPVFAADANVTIEQVALGLAGQFKAGYWTPVRIEVRGGSQPWRGQLQIVTPDGDGVPTRFTWPDRVIDIAAGESRPITALVKLGRITGSLFVELQASGTVAAQRAIPLADIGAGLSAEQPLILGYGPPIGLGGSIQQRSRGEIKPAVVELTDASKLPDDWLGYEVVDTFVLTTSDRAQLAALSDPQWRALKDWVHMGGRLIVSVGEHGNELLASTDRFAEFAPGTFHGMSGLRSLSMLETFTGSTQRLDLPADVAEVPIVALENVRGRIELSDTSGEQPRPMIVRAPFGFGQVVFVTFDLDHRALARWADRPRLLARLLQESNERQDRRRDEPIRSDDSRFGYRDIVGQLRSGLEQFPSVTLVPFAWIAGLILIYIALIGPVDFFFLRDVLRKMHLTWVTFPLVTVAFAGLAVALHPQWKGTAVRVNHVDVVDVDVASSLARGTSWAHVYSPRATAFDVAFEPNLSANSGGALSPGNLVAWQGLPGTSLSGLQTATAPPPIATEYTIAESAETTRRNQIQQVPIDVAATKSVIDRWWQPVQLTTPDTLSIDADGLLRGDVTNPLPIELTDCVVFFENWAYRLDSTRGVLAPGQKTRIEDERGLNLQWRLNGRRVIDQKDVSTPWDLNTLDVPRILEMMMFHEAAGGQSYTQLVQRYQSFIDLSRHLVTGRAILLGRTKQPAAALKLNNRPVTADQQWTYFRVIYPVASKRTQRP